MKKYKNEIITFTIPIIILLLGMFLNKIYPFGNKILLMLDGYNQYPGFLNTFKEIILNKQTIFYTFRGLTGFNLYASSVYYTFNITNLFFLLFKTSHIVDFYTSIIIIKIALTSLSMYTFLNYINKKNYNIIFSICYSLTTYNLLYYLNYMWFESIILLPLVTLGIEKIFNENKYYYYTITLTLSILLNFYIGYMICIFSVIYFIYKWLLNNHPKDRLIKYIIYSLISGLLCAFTLIPIILELLNGKGALFTNTEYFKFDLDFINAFYKLTIGSFLNGDLEYGTPNIYVSLFIYFNVVLFFFNKNIKFKEKILTSIIIIFFLLSMSFNLLDYFWQMLQMPIYYPVRYAFIFDFYLIYVAYKNYISYEKFSTKKTIIILLIIIILSSIGFITSGNLHDKINIPAKLIYLAVSILFILYYGFIINNKDFKRFIYAVVIIELSINTFLTLRNNGNMNYIETYKTKYDINYNTLKKIKLDNFNKVSFDEKVIKNNGLLLNYNDINYFSSVRNNKVFESLNKVFGILTLDGCNTEYYYNNPITNAILGIKYFITKDNLNYYELIDTYKNYNIYQNNDITSIGFITNNLNKFTINEDYLTNINNLVKIINNNDEDILKEVKYIKSNISCNKDSNFCITNGNEGYIKYEYISKNNELIFIQNDYPSGKDETKYSILINDNIFEYNTHYPIKLSKKDNISLTINPGSDFKTYYYHLYVINEDIYKELIKNINNEKLIITDYKNDASFTGKVTLKEDGLLFTTISNDKGWKIYVDDKETTITPVLDGFIGINLTKGEHQITFKYTPPGLKIGLIISSIALISFSLILFKDKEKTSN